MSQKQPGVRRTTQSSSHDPDDAFIARMLHFTKWAEGNHQVLTVGVVILAIVAAGFVYYGRYQSQLFEQAAQQLEVIHQSISISDTEGAKVELATFLDRFDGTPHEGEARLILGELYLESGDPQQALAVLGPLGESPREPIEFQGAALLGSALEQDGRWEDAESTYLTIASRSDLDFQIRSALNAAARIRTDRGDSAGAIELYERVLGGLEDTSPERGLYEMRIAELQGASSS